MRYLLPILLSLSTVAHSQPQMAFAPCCMGGFARHQTLMINYTQFTGVANVTNYTCYLSFADQTLATTANNGFIQHTVTQNSITVPADLIFSTDPLGITTCPYWVQSYSSSTGAIMLQIQIPTVYYNQNTYLFMMYGRADITTFQGGTLSQVWPSYFLVYPMMDNAASNVVTDYSGNGSNGVCSVNTSTLSASGQLGNALAFTSSNYASVSSNFSSTKQITIDYWQNVPSFSNADYLCMEYTANVNANIGSFSIDPNSSGGGGAPSGFYACNINTSDGTLTLATSAFTRPSTSTWHHYTFVINKTLTTCVIACNGYIDGILQTSSTYNDGHANTAFANSILHINSRNNTSLMGNETLNYIKIYNGLFSASQISLDQAAQQTNQTLITRSKPY